MDVVSVAPLDEEGVRPASKLGVAGTSVYTWRPLYMLQKQFLHIIIAMYTSSTFIKR